MNKEKCDCLLGIVHSYNSDDFNNLRRSDYLEKCKYMADRANYNNAYFGRKKVIKPSYYLDKRKNYADIYDFCPRCGKKTDFKEIRKVLNGTKVNIPNGKFSPFRT